MVMIPPLFCAWLESIQKMKEIAKITPKLPSVDPSCINAVRKYEARERLWLNPVLLRHYYFVPIHGAEIAAVSTQLRQRLIMGRLFMSKSEIL